MAHVRSMRDYFEDQNQGYTLAGQALPTPSDTPYDTPRPRSRLSSRNTTSPPPFPPDHEKGQDTEHNEEELSPLDPRRFTPTLHASLVSEILSLRNELDSKHRFIENLEQNLDNSRTENEALNERLLEATKENRSAKRQLKHVEEGTLAALQELARERDDLKVVQTDLRNKLEVSQKRVKTQEDDAVRIHDIHNSEKAVWENEKRAFERKIHVSESRLKNFINEVNAQHAAEFGPENDDLSDGEEGGRDSGLGNESDGTSVHSSPSRNRPSHSRGGSISSLQLGGKRQSNRFSMESTIGSGRQSRQQGLSLADELVFDEEEEDLDDLEEIEDEYADRETKLRRARESRQSFTQDDKAKRVLGLSNGRESASDNYDSLDLQRRDPIGPIEEVESFMEKSIVEDEPAVGSTKKSYVDTGIQYSPPASPSFPIMKPSSPPTSPESIQMLPDKAISTAEVEANQSRKRVASPPRSPSPQLRRQVSRKPSIPAVVMVSSAVQTVEEAPISVPKASEVAVAETIEERAETSRSYSTVSTQTEPLKDEINDERPETPPSQTAQFIVPSIAIHPPLSNPSSPRVGILPPATRNAACQADLRITMPTSNAATQTERITIDPRLLKLPPHLWPSALKDKDRPIVKTTFNTVESLSSTTAKQNVGDNTKPTLPISTSLPSLPSPTSPEDRYPGNNDNGPLVKDVKNGQGPRRPFRSASLFAGFGEDENGDETDLDEPAQVKPRTAPQSSVASRLAKNGFSFSDPPTPVPEEKESPYNEATKKARQSSVASEDVESTTSDTFAGGRSSFERNSRVAKPLKMANSSRQPSIRRSALISNGTATHLRHGSRTPSEVSFGSTSVSSSMAPQPPFPVPLRSSSRRVPHTRSEGSNSPTPGQNSLFSARRSKAQVSAQHPGKEALRKVRSANVIPRYGRTGRGRSRSPPGSITSPTSPKLPEQEIPELPKDNVKSPRHVFELQKTNSKVTRSDVPSRTGSASVGSSGPQQSNVVDAIAVTMVGEWMWKYVRRRKSFGVPESPSEVSKPGEDGSITVTSNGQRHKRWVWLSPYERSVMWSSKQPSSNSALMGKSGRKLIIQSVLDVKDDTPFPKHATTIFNRSILILTPARALKFTALSSERHYLWLTALSFLSHHPSQRLSPLPAIPVPEPKSLTSPAVPNGGPVEPQIPVPTEEPVQPTRTTATLRRTPLRDSVRIAKTRGGVSPHRRPGAPIRNATAPPTLPEQRETCEANGVQTPTGSAFFDRYYTERPSKDTIDMLRPGTAGTVGTTGTVDSGAEYPTVPRYAARNVHGRKRSSSGPVIGPPKELQLQTTTSSSGGGGRHGSLRGWPQWPDNLRLSSSGGPSSRDGASSAPPVPALPSDFPPNYADTNESTATIAPPPIQRSRTADHGQSSFTRPPLPSSHSQPGSATGSGGGDRANTMRMEAFVEPPPSPWALNTSVGAKGGEEGPLSAPVGKTGFLFESIVPNSLRTGRRVPGMTTRRRSRVPEAWTRGVVGAGAQGEGDEGGVVGGGDPFRGF
ncbi:MAG: hypothetical protein M1820_008009 [Bogoriella megaspora]|nr:MAG: hypothetical protein M1820_008009 [Bogoriella megaspora]